MLLTVRHVLLALGVGTLSSYYAMRFVLYCARACHSVGKCRCAPLNWKCVAEYQGLGETNTHQFLTLTQQSGRGKRNCTHMYSQARTWAGTTAPKERWAENKHTQTCLVNGNDQNNSLEYQTPVEKKNKNKNGKQWLKGTESLGQQRISCTTARHPRNGNHHDLENKKSATLA